MIDHYGGMDTRGFKEVTEVGSQLIQLSEIVGSRSKARVAILHDRESCWAMEDSQGPRNKGLHYKDTLIKMYHGLRRLGLNVDILDMEEELKGYDLVFAPMLYMFRSDIETKIRNYIAAGGTFVMTYWSGIVNESDLCHLGGTPHQLMDVLDYEAPNWMLFTLMIETVVNRQEYSLKRKSSMNVRISVI